MKHNLITTGLLAVCVSAIFIACGSVTPEATAVESIDQPYSGPMGNAVATTTNSPAIDLPQRIDAAGPTLAVRPPKKDFPEPANYGGYCNVITGVGFVTCTPTGLMTSDKAMSIKKGTSYVSVQYKNLISWCKNNKLNCVTKLKTTLNTILVNSKPKAACGTVGNASAGQITVQQQTTKMKVVKLAVTVGGIMIIGASGATAGFALAPYAVYLKVLTGSGFTLVGAIYGEWAWAWLYTASYTDSGPSVVASLLVAAYETLGNLVSNMDDADSTISNLSDYHSAIAESPCPASPYSWASGVELLPV
jgi:hypothetical protein